MKSMLKLKNTKNPKRKNKRQQTISKNPKNTTQTHKQKTTSKENTIIK